MNKKKNEVNSNQIGINSFENKIKHGKMRMNEDKTRKGRNGKTESKTRTK